MQYPIIDLITSAYINNGWTGLDIPQTINYEPIQLGSGDPTPTNVRPILPATILNIGGTNVPVYGGTLNTTTGVLTIDRGYRILDGNDGSTYRNNGQTENTTRAFVQIPDKANGLSNIISNMFYFDDFEDVIGRMTGRSTNNGVEFFLPATVPETVAGVMEWFAENKPTVCYELATFITYQLTQTELYYAIGIKDDIAHRLKLPLPHYFPHPVIDALQRAAAGTQTADDTEILQHYLTPLGIGGI